MPKVRLAFLLGQSVEVTKLDPLCMHDGGGGHTHIFRPNFAQIRYIGKRLGAQCVPPPPSLIRLYGVDRTGYPPPFYSTIITF